MLRGLSESPPAAWSCSEADLDLISFTMPSSASRAISCWRCIAFAILLSASYSSSRVGVALYFRIVGIAVLAVVRRRPSAQSRADRAGSEAAEG